MKKLETFTLFFTAMTIATGLFFLLIKEPLVLNNIILYGYIIIALFFTFALLQKGVIDTGKANIEKGEMKWKKKKQ